MASARDLDVDRRQNVLYFDELLSNVMVKTDIFHEF